jgi:Ni2+-binding GTPase involved in maturation of urease and hydrogenase
MKLNGKFQEFKSRKLRVLVVGPTHSGKSSFIDSISSALRDEIVMRAVGGRIAAEEDKEFSSTEKVFHICIFKKMFISYITKCVFLRD